MYQQITLIGNLGSDPEMRYTPSGVPVASFSLAVNKTWTGQDGQRQDKTTWFRVTTWRKTAEIVSQYLNKGSKVLVVGELEDARTWTDRDGNQRASLEVTAQTVKFLSGRGDVTGVSESSSGGHASSNNHAESPELRDEDIPF
ncbi:single-stranded DNA-binding protein [soil metagenome]